MGEMSSQTPTEPTETPSKGLLGQLLAALSHAIQRLMGAPTASVGEIVYFTDSQLVTSFSAYTGRVINIETPALGADSEWWYEIEPTTAAGENNLCTDIPDTYWIRDDLLTTNPNARPDTHDIAAALDADYPALISYDQLEDYVQTALSDLGFRATVTIDRTSQTVSATLAQTTADPPSTTIAGAEGPNSDPTAPIQTRTAVQPTTATATDEGDTVDEATPTDELEDVATGATDEAVAAAVATVETDTTSEPTNGDIEISVDTDTSTDTDPAPAQVPVQNTEAETGTESPEQAPEPEPDPAPDAEPPPTPSATQPRESKPMESVTETALDTGINTNPDTAESAGKTGEESEPENASDNTASSDAPGPETPPLMTTSPDS
jgi:hypothetical protein